MPTVTDPSTTVPLLPQRLKGWGQYLSAETRLHRAGRLAELQRDWALLPRPLAVRGAGCAYGDASLASHGAIVALDRFDHMRAFDAAGGLLTVEAGATVRDVMSVGLPRGWTLPVTPGYSHISIGGCIAADVHSKNHYRYGGFGAAVRAMRLLTASGAVVTASPEENADLFHATIGGLGMTGVVLEATLQLKAVESAYVEQTVEEASGLEALLARMRALTDAGAAAETDYTVGWLNLLPRRGPVPGLVVRSNYASAAAVQAASVAEPLAVAFANGPEPPLPVPTIAANRLSVGAFNWLYHYLGRRRSVSGAARLLSLPAELFPWDGMPNWHKYYGPKGFIEYQVCLPIDTAADAIAAMVASVRADRETSGVFLAAIKRMGGTAAPLGFTQDGFSLLMDFRATPAAFRFLDRMDAIVADAGGRVYLAKDGRLSQPLFQRMFPDAGDWLAVKQRWDPDGVFASDLGRRLGLCPPIE